MHRPAKLIIGTIVALAATTLAPAAEATFPGPNGKIAFERGGNIWVMNPNGSDQVRLTATGKAADPQWSADGKKIAYDQVSAKTGRDIWVMNGNGAGRYRVTTHVKNEYDPTWSPDGRWLAFVSDRRGRGEIYKVRSTTPFGTAIRLSSTAGTGEPEKTYEDPYLWDGEPAWSPAGDRIAFSRYMRFDDYSWFSWDEALMTMNVNGTGVLQAESTGYGVTCPSWGPAGVRIAWVDNEYEWQDGAAANNVWHTTPDGTDRVAVTHFARFDASTWDLGGVSWSPYRGTQIVFSGFVDDLTGIGPPAIYLVPSSGRSKPVRLAWNGADPDWGRAPA